MSNAEQIADLQFLRLLQLASPTLPVGAYSYSQGLEWVVSTGTVHDAASARTWIEDVLRFGVASFELPCLTALRAAAERRDCVEISRLNSIFLASRESAELRAETLQMGRSLVRLIQALEAARPAHDLLQGIAEPSFPCAWACAAAAFGLPAGRCRQAYAWAWLENQVLAAIKLVPLGQSDGQRMLVNLAATVVELCAKAAPAEDSWTNFAPGLGLASSAHEIQYTRLFRS